MTKALILIVITLLLLILIYSSFSRSYIVFAAAYSCENYGDLTVRCCANITDNKGETHRYCTDCTNSDPPSNCGPRYVVERLNPPVSPPTNALPPSPPPLSNALPPSSTSQSQQQTRCPDSSVSDANGNCPTNTNQQVGPPSNLGGSASNNNPQSANQHHKEKIGAGESATKKGNSGGG
jgi:hypothetical protein